MTQLEKAKYLRDYFKESVRVVGYEHMMFLRLPEPAKKVIMDRGKELVDVWNASVKFLEEHPEYGKSPYGPPEEAEPHEWEAGDRPN